ncbi:MAG: type II toxin-antitoxin system RelE/ParE family toxin [Candidatus Devosia phytovorans]|uniref:Type II toxin-antitoxin system RelE/ParE family toxin n=1 Tax=Candidatus Devosia phytovorans TaxID=3121372 RepID=A0AAJ6AZQ9_9HYPH|nr:type II toxin-antitoxin system RelE/ParE family toxin [Devosia sp.]WEK04402.1 MAG: type II toxin-antitoxin system RelE/ParE family toxin [Devosia sp.]
MRRRVVWSLDALDDIDEHNRYIALESAAAANRSIDRLERAATLLGEVAIGRPGRVAGTFEKSVAGTPYVLCYALHEATGALVVLRVIHSARDWPKDSWPD